MILTDRGGRKSRGENPAGRKSSDENYAERKSCSENHARRKSRMRKSREEKITQNTTIFKFETKSYSFKKHTIQQDQ
jgi:hypothetical protein